MFHLIIKTFSYFESFFEPQIFDPRPQEYTSDPDTQKILTNLFQSSDYIQMLRQIENSKNVTIKFTPYHSNESFLNGKSDEKFIQLEICYNKSLSEEKAHEAILNITKQTLQKFLNKPLQ